MSMISFFKVTVFLGVMATGQEQDIVGELATVYDFLRDHRCNGTYELSNLCHRILSLTRPFWFGPVPFKMSKGKHLWLDKSNMPALYYRQLESEYLSPPTMHNFAKGAVPVPSQKPEKPENSAASASGGTGSQKKIIMARSPGSNIDTTKPMPTASKAAVAKDEVLKLSDKGVVVADKVIVIKFCGATEPGDEATLVKSLSKVVRSYKTVRDSVRIPGDGDSSEDHYDSTLDQLFQDAMEEGDSDSEEDEDKSTTDVS